MKNAYYYINLLTTYMKRFWPAEWVLAWTVAIAAVGAGVWWKVNHPSPIDKSKPIAFDINISTAGKVAHLVMPRNWSALCQKWVEELPVVKKVDEFSQDTSFQHEWSPSGYLDQDRLSTNTSPENLYTFTRGRDRDVILRIINRDWSTTRKLYTEAEKNLAVAECNKK
jgi:hypothetical protein